MRFSRLTSVFFAHLLRRACAVPALLLLLGLLTRPAQAQVPDTVATEPLVVAPAIDCGPVKAAEMCVDFDARRSVDPAAGQLEYRWNMGDGTTLTGLTISHCYKERQHYQVVLSVLVVNTGEVRPREKVFDIDLTQQDVLNFSVTPGTTIHVNQPVVFQSVDSVLPTCQMVSTIWDFRDGLTDQGTRVQHTFHKPGRFQVRMSLRGYGEGKCSFSNCVSQEVVVEP